MKILLFLTFIIFSINSFADCSQQEDNLNYVLSRCKQNDDMFSSDLPYQYRYIDNHDDLTFRLCCTNNPAIFNTVNCGSTPYFAFHKSCFGGTSTPAKKVADISNPASSCGSIIQTTNRVVGERILLIGVPFELIYFSNRVIGRTADYNSEIKITQATYSATDLSYDLTVRDENGAIIYYNSYAPASNIVYTYGWNGLDSTSNETWGPVSRKFNIHISKSNSTQVPDNLSEIFLGSLKAKKLGTGAWLPSIWHYYDEVSETLYKGDGTIRKVKKVIDGSYSRIADENGREIYYFDNTGKISHTKTGLTGTTIYTFAYDSAGRILSITQPFNKVTTFVRYLDGTLKEIVSPNGIVTNLSLDTNGYLSQVTNAANETYQMSYYGTGGLLSSFTVPSGDVTSLTYDSEGNLISDTHSNGTSSTLSVGTNGINTVSSLGRTTQTKFNGTATETIINPTNYQEVIGNYPTYTTISSQRLEQTTNYIDNPRFTSQAKLTSKITSTNFGTRTSNFTNTIVTANTTDPFAITSIVKKETITPSINIETYTGSNKTTNFTTKLGRTSLVQIDQYERPIMAQIGNLNSKNYFYTDDLLTSILEGTRQNTLTYNSIGLLESITNSLSETTSFTYDAAQRLKTTILPDLREIEYTYDYNGNLKNITPPQRPVHQLTYGLNDKISGYQPPSLTGIANVNTSYTYNNDKQLTKITRPDGQEINFNYNATTGLRSSITGSFGTITNNSYTNEMPALITDQYGTKLTNSYTRGTVSSVTLAKGTTNVWSYARTPHSVGGKILTETIKGLGTSSVQQVLNYGYDDDEYMTSVGTLSLAYNVPNGQLTGTTLGDITDVYTYNSYGEVETYQAKHLTNVIYSYSLTRDAIGRVATKTETLNGVTTVYGYTYDSSGRLTEVTTNSVLTSTYLYDDNSNRVGGLIRGEATIGVYDDQDRLTNYNGTALTYNANGELLTKGSITTDYDVFGNLKSWSNGTTAITYEIDPAQRRMGRSVGGVLGARYMYSPEGRLIGQLDSANKLMKTFVYGSKGHVPDYYIDSSNNKFRIISDHLGSVRLVVNSAGVVQQVMEHDEFGRVLQDTNPGLTPFGFAGGVYDPTTSLVTFGARDYDPYVGRWASKDPIRFAGGDPNLYGYVFNDPVNLIDSNGKFAMLPLVGVIAGAGIAQGVGQAIGTFAVTGSYRQAYNSFGSGFISGATAGAMASGALLFGFPGGIAAAITSGVMTVGQAWSDSADILGPDLAKGHQEFINSCKGK